MRKMLLIALVGFVLSCAPVWAQQAGQKASEGEAAEAAPARVEEAEPAPAETKEAAPAESSEPATEESPEAAEPEMEGRPVVVESEGSGPVAAFWFVVPERS